jgi:hypothetical protein
MSHLGRDTFLTRCCNWVQGLKRGGGRLILQLTLFQVYYSAIFSCGGEFNLRLVPKYISGSRQLIFSVNRTGERHLVTKEITCKVNITMVLRITASFLFVLFMIWQKLILLKLKCQRVCFVWGNYSVFTRGTSWSLNLLTDRNHHLTMWFGSSFSSGWT